MDTLLLRVGCFERDQLTAADVARPSIVIVFAQKLSTLELLLGESFVALQELGRDASSVVEKDFGASIGTRA